MMDLATAHDALSDMVSAFYNTMLREGRKEMSPREWCEEFARWLDPYEFERRWRLTTQWFDRTTP
jgi:hypothetical protein